MNNKIFSLFKNLSNNFDAIMFTDPKILHYYTKISALEGILLALRTKKIFVLVDFRYFEIAKTTLTNFNVVLFQNLKSTLGEILTKNSCSTIAVSSKGLLAETLFKLQDWFKQFKFELSSQLDSQISAQQAVKTELEIEKIIQAQQVTSNVFKKIVNFIRPGLSELEIAREINSLICKEADSVAFETIVVSGKRTSLPHGRPTAKKVQNGELITLDFGAVIDGYCSDMTRTVCLGNCSTRQREIYELVLSAQKMAIDSIELGTKCCQIDLKVREYFNKFGYSAQFGHSLGHGVGLFCHEHPFLSPKSLSLFENNMVFTVEPGLYFEQEFGIRIEDLILIKNNNVVNLTKCTKKLLCL